MANRLFRKYWYLTVAAVLLFASASFAQTTVTLTGVGDSATLGNVYVDPYTATVGNYSSVSVICDDWSDNTYLNETWQANVTTLSSVTNSSTTPLFAKSGTNAKGTTTPATLYTELAYLGSLLMANSLNPTSQIEISFAMWELTYNYAPNPEATSPSTYLSQNGTAAEISEVSTLLTNLPADIAGFNTTGWSILTPTGSGISCSGGPCPTAPPQEFLVYNLGNGNGNGETGGGGGTSAPESSATVLFGADMLGLLGLVVVFRRRLLGQIQ